jgi:two-component system, chemotaxis family, response regulator Rcp1
MNAPASFEILMVEDNPGDVRLIQEALKDCRTPHHLTAVVDGEEALAYLRRQGGYREARTPHLVLLDLNLPRMDGRELLSQLKRDPQFQRIPVIVLTTSSADLDIQRSYELHANCYIVKPIAVDQVFAVVRAIESFWFTIARLPTTP